MNNDDPSNNYRMVYKYLASINKVLYNGNKAKTHRAFFDPF